MTKLIVVNVAARAEYACDALTTTGQRDGVSQNCCPDRPDGAHREPGEYARGHRRSRYIVVTRRGCVGVKDHPTVTDTDIQRGDTFALNGINYRVVDLVFVPGEVQARCEADNDG